MGTHGVMVVFDLTNWETFYHVEYWIQEVRKKAAEQVVIYLVGNKADLEEREVSRAEAEKIAGIYGVQYRETSAQNHLQIRQAILDMADDMLRVHGVTMHSVVNINPPPRSTCC